MSQFDDMKADIEKSGDADQLAALAKIESESAKEPEKVIIPEPVKEPEKVIEKEPEKIIEKKIEVERPSDSVPSWVARELREKQKVQDEQLKTLLENSKESVTKKDLEGLKSLLTDIKTAKTPEEKKDAYEEYGKFAEENAASPELAKEMLKKAVEIVKSQIPSVQGLSDEDRATLQFAREERTRIEGDKKVQEQKSYWNNKFEEEFALLSTENPDVKGLHDELKAKYFSPDYSGEGKMPYQLKHIFAIEKDSLVTPHKKSSDNGGIPSNKQVLNLDTESDDFLEKLMDAKNKGSISDEDFMKAVEAKDNSDEQAIRKLRAPK